MAEYDSAIAMALRLITKKGQTATLRNFTAVAPADANKPWKPGVSTPVNQTPKMVFLDYEQKFIDGAVIKMGDQRVFIPASGLTAAPTVEGLILRGSEVWKIKAVKPLNPAGDPIMYEVQARQ